MIFYSGVASTSNTKKSYVLFIFDLSTHFLFFFYFFYLRQRRISWRMKFQLKSKNIQRKIMRWKKNIFANSRREYIFHLLFIFKHFLFLVFFFWFCLSSRAFQWKHFRFDIVICYMSLCRLISRTAREKRPKIGGWRGVKHQNLMLNSFN